MLKRNGTSDASGATDQTRPALCRGTGLVRLSLGLLLVAMLLLLCWDGDFRSLLTELKLRSRAWMPESVARMLWTALHVWPRILVTPFLDPTLYVVVAGVFLLERLFAARPGQAWLSTGMIQDLLRFVLHGFLSVIVISVMMESLHALYEHHLSVLTVHAIQTWPLGLKLALVVLVNDFLDWFHHVVHHKVPVFCSFHAVHHSQRQMNMFTDGRVHLADAVIANCLVCIPIFMFTVDATLAAR